MVRTRVGPDKTLERPTQTFSITHSVTISGSILPSRQIPHHIDSAIYVFLRLETLCAACLQRFNSGYMEGRHRKCVKSLPVWVILQHQQRICCVPRVPEPHFTIITTADQHILLVRIKVQVTNQLAVSVLYCVHRPKKITAVLTHWLAWHLFLFWRYHLWPK